MQSFCGGPRQLWQTCDSSCASCLPAKHHSAALPSTTVQPCQALCAFSTSVSYREPLSSCFKIKVVCFLMHHRREMEKMKDAVNAAAGGEGIPTRRIAGDAGREYILQTEEDTKAKAALEAGLMHFMCCCMHVLHPGCNRSSVMQLAWFHQQKISCSLTTADFQVAAPELCCISATWGQRCIRIVSAASMLFMAVCNTV